MKPRTRSSKLGAITGLWSQGFIRRFGEAIALAVVLSLTFPAAARELRIAGTGNALGAMRLLAAAYRKANPGVEVLVMASIGSSGALKAVPEGAIDIGLSTRPPTEEEAQSGLAAIQYARTATVFAVRRNNPVTSLTASELAAIYSGEMRHWPDGTPTRPVLRQPGDDNLRQAEGISPAMKQALLAAEKRPGLPFAVTDQEAADKAESIPGSLTITTVALILSESRRLKPLALDGVEPTLYNVAAGRYPLVKRFYLVLPKAPSAEAQSFVKFVASAPAREILKRTGHLVP